MSQLDVLFRAFADYRKNTIEERDCVRARKAIARACAGSDRLEVVKTECDIEDDWIDEIEKGLVFIGNAIAEERQFIRSNGEVLDIEKVKSVSKESVEHLARHSNLFAKEREGEDNIPTRLFTVERLTDYAVYENRFLYMLLCFLRDFVAYRYERIVDLTHTYNGKLCLNKTVESGNRKMTLEIRLDEERKNDVFLTEHNAAKEKIDRIDGLLKTTVAYLAMPLMEFVAKAPKLKPPVTETNVLKMNKNFNGAMQTYYFIAAYDKDGFSVRQSTISLNPFDDAVADEFAEAAQLCSFLTYEHGMKIEGALQKVYEERKERERRAAEERERQQLQNLKRRVEETGKGAEEYMLLLERRLNLLENDSFQLSAARAENEKLSAVIVRLNKNIKEIAGIAQERKKQAEELAAAHRIETERLTEEWQTRVRTVEETAESEKNRLVGEHAAALQAERAESEEKMQEAAAGYSRTIEECRQQAAEKIAGLQERIEQFECEAETAKAELERRAVEAERLELERTLYAAQLNTLKKECGRFTDEDCFTSHEQFDELERQYKVFKSFFKDEWRKTKKKIRADLLHDDKDME